MTVIKSEQNECLLKALAIALKVEERSSSKSTRKENLHLDRASVQTREMQRFMQRMKAEKNIESSMNFSVSLSRNNTTPASVRSESTEEALSPAKPLVIQDFEYLATTSSLRHFCISVYDSNFMGTFLMCYNNTAEKH